MPVYQYRAMTPDGKDEQGVVDADTPKDARTRLRQRKLMVTELAVVAAPQAVSAAPGAPKRVGGRGRRLQEVALLTRQLATLLNSGIPIMGSMAALVEQAEDRALKAVLLGVKEALARGAPLSDALAGQPSLFNELYLNMVRAGEASGALDAVLFRLADYLHAQNRLRNRLIAALTYPAIIVSVGVAVVIFLLTSVVPRIMAIFQQRGMLDALPLPTTILLAISTFLSKWWWALVILLIGGVVMLKMYTRTANGRRWWDRLMLTVPIFGPLFRKTAISRFSITLATLLESGLPVLEALRVVQNVVANTVLAEAIETVRKRIAEGADIATPLKATKIFPPVVTYMVAVGEESGQLEKLLRKVAEAYDEEVEIAAQRMVSALEPIMILTLGFVVGFIVLSILLPILQMSQI